VDPNQDAFRPPLDLDAAGVTIDDEAEPHGHLPRGVAVVRPRTTPRLSTPSGRRSGRTSVARSRRLPRRCARSVAPTDRGLGSGRHPGVDPNLAPGGHSKVDDPTGRRKEISERVFGIDPALDRVAFPAHLAL